MKNIICMVLYFMVQVGSSVLFTLNDLGINTWQWWAQFSAIFISHLIGMIRMVDFE